MSGAAITAAKFGGSSVCTGWMIELVRTIVEADPSRRAIVVSAPGIRAHVENDLKVTDLLIYWFQNGAQDTDAHFMEVVERFQQICANLSLADFDLEAKIDELLKQKAVEEIGVTESYRHYIVSRGEWLNAQIVAAYLDYEFVDAASFISFNAHGKYDHARTIERAESIQLKSKALRGIVVPGFYGSEPNGSIVTFPRDGSDISGAILASLVKATAYENFSDIEGFLSASPKVVANPAKIEEMTFEEARELSFMGASVLQAHSVKYARDANIPIHVRKTDVSLPSGTWIRPTISRKPKFPVTGIAARSGGAIVTISKYGMDDENGFLARAARVFAENDIGVHNCPGSVDTLSFIILDQKFRQRIDRVKAGLEAVCAADSIQITMGITVICVVGRGMVHIPGMAARITGALGEAHINILTLNQGSSERNIEIGVLDAHGDGAIRAIYSALMT